VLIFFINIPLEVTPGTTVCPRINRKTSLFIAIQYMWMSVNF